MIPTVYIIRPKSGWDWNDYADNWIHDWTSQGKIAFESKGYNVQVIDGCTANQFKTLVARNSTVGIILASHGTPFGIGIQVDRDEDSERGISLEPSDLRNHSPNIQFFGAVGCDLSPREVNKIAENLHLHKARVLTPPSGYLDARGNISGFEALGPVLQQATRILPNADSLHIGLPKRRRPFNYELMLNYSRHSLVPRTVVRPIYNPNQAPFIMRLTQQRQQEKARQQALEDARRRQAQDAARRQLVQEADQRRRMEESIRQRIAAETAIRQRRAQEEALRRREQQKAEQKRAQQDATRRQLALQVARSKQPPRNIIRPEFWIKPKHVVLPKTHHLQMTFGPATSYFPGSPPKILPGTKWTTKWTRKW